MKEIKLTDKDKNILDIIAAHCGSISPTEIGMKMGKCYTQASSYCNSSLKRLIAVNKIIKDKGRYKIKL